MNREDLVTETFKKQGLQEAYYKNVYIPDFARDIVLYGRSDAMGVLASYDLTPEDFQKISKLPLFLAEVGNLKKRLANSENAAVQIKAVELLDATLHIMQSRLVGGELSTKELVEVGKFLADITGAKVVQAKGSDIIGPVNTGTVVKINYGADLDKLPMLPEDAPVNDTYKKIAHLYDTKAKVIYVEAD